MLDVRDQAVRLGDHGGNADSLVQQMRETGAAAAAALDSVDACIKDLGSIALSIDEASDTGQTTAGANTTGDVSAPSSQVVTPGEADDAIVGAFDLPSDPGSDDTHGVDDRPEYDPDSTDGSEGAGGSGPSVDVTTDQQGDHPDAGADTAAGSGDIDANGTGSDDESSQRGNVVQGDGDGEAATIEPAAVATDTDNATGDDSTSGTDAGASDSDNTGGGDSAQHGSADDTGADGHPAVETGDDAGSTLGDTGDANAAHPGQDTDPDHEATEGEADSEQAFDLDEAQATGSADEVIAPEHVEAQFELPSHSESAEATVDSAIVGADQAASSSLADSYDGADAE